MRFRRLLINTGAKAILAAGFITCSEAAAAVPPANKEGVLPATALPEKVEVVDFRGVPIGNAVVKLQERPAAPLPHLLKETTITITGEDGSFRPPVETPKGSILVVEKKNFAEMAYLPESVPRRIILPPGARLMGTVVNEAGTSIPGALIGPVVPPLICDHGPSDVSHPSCNPLRFTRTNEKGFFRVDGLPIHKYEFLVRAPGYQPKLVQAITGAPFKVMLTTGGTTVTGQVLGSKDQRPQAGHYVQAQLGPGALRLYEITDIDGKFAFGNLSPGEWVFNACTDPETTPRGARTLQVPAETSVTLLLDQGRNITGRVIEEETSSPISNLPLTLLGSENRNSLAVSTGVDGSFNFPEVDALEQFTLRFDPVQFTRVLPDGSTRDYFEVPPADKENAGPVELVLRKKAPLQGYVMDIGGSPVAAAQVQFTATSVPANTTMKHEGQAATPVQVNTLSNSSGYFKAGLFPPGRYKVQARKDNLVSETTEVDAFTTRIAAPLQVRLVPTRQLSGIVVDSEDKPVTGALVKVIPGERLDVKIDEHDVTSGQGIRTNSDGWFTIEGLVPGQEITLRATHPEFVQAARGTFTPGAPTSETTGGIVLQFPSGNELKIFVQDSEGKAVAGAEVIMHYTVGIEGSAQERHTDRWGFLRVRDLPVQQLERLVVRHPAHTELEITDPVSLSQSDHRLTLTKKGTITVHVQGNPAGSAPHEPEPVVTLLQVPSSSSAASLNEPPDGSAFVERSRSGLKEGRAVFNNLDPGWYKAAVIGGNSFAESDAVQLEGNGANLELAINAGPGSALEGRVRDKSTGQGISGASVSVAPAANFAGAEGFTPLLAVTTESGDFTLENAPAGALKLRILASGYPHHEETIATSRRGTPLNIMLSNEPGAITGTVSLNNQAVAGALLVLSNRSAAESPVASAITDANGRYQLTGFPVGNYVLSIEAPFGEGEDVLRRSQEVNVTGSNIQVDIVLPLPVTVSGSARLGGKIPKYPDGNTPSLMFMPKAGGADARHAQLDENGNFTVQLEPGTYSVGIEDRPGVEVQIPATGVNNLQLSF